MLSRRRFLNAGTLSLAGLTLSDLLAARASAGPPSAAVQTRAVQARSEQASSGKASETPPVGVHAGGSFGRAKACILLFMWGGPAHQDTWDLKPDAPAEIRGEFKPIATKVPGLQICEHFPQLAERTDRLCIVRSMTHNNVDHTPATHFLLTGQAPPPTADPRMQWPHFGATLARMGRGRGALPPFVSMRPKLENDVPRFVEQTQGQGAGWLGPVWDPLTIDSDPSRPDYRVGELAPRADLPAERLQQRLNLRAMLGDGLSSTSLPRGAKGLAPAGLSRSEASLRAH
ncbi:MAG TPA: DUF1501 domain-containing protein, partial [Pirellulaceae bacterium]|nr:DUF1501 domain-containing protein [Pirellulaceae bacterium]